MARQTERKFTNSTHYEAYENGKLVSGVRHNTYSIGSEEDYVKIYFSGSYYLVDMPSDCMRLLLLLLPHVRYAEPPDSRMADYSLTVTIDPAMRKQLAATLGYKKVNSVSNLLTELCDGGVLERVYKTVYRVNPHLFGRGSVKDMAEMKHNSTPPEPNDTFMSVYTAKKEVKENKKQANGSGDGIPDDFNVPTE